MYLEQARIRCLEKDFFLGPMSRQTYVSVPGSRRYDVIRQGSYRLDSTAISVFHHDVRAGINSYQFGNSYLQTGAGKADGGGVPASGKVAFHGLGEVTRAVAGVAATS